MLASSAHKPRLVMRMALVALTVLFSFCLFGAQLTAQSTADWQAGSGNWSVAGNWNCGSGFPNGCVPNAGTAIGIRNGGSVILDINATVQSTDIGAGTFSAGNSLTLASGGVGVGGVGQGVLNIQSGAVVNSASVFINPAGTVNVSGSGSQWNTTFIEVGVGVDGLGGPGQLNVTQAAVVNSFNGGGGGFIGTFGGTGTVLVSDSGSQWNLPFLEIGSTGNGTLTIQNSGVVNGGGTSIGTFSGSSGSAIVTGVGSQLIASSLCVGCAGQGALTIQSGGLVTTGFGGGSIGDSSGGPGVVTVDGVGPGAVASTWTTSGQVLLGTGAGTNGTLNVQNGAKFSTSNDLTVGQNGNGTLMIASGGQVNNVNGNVGLLGGSMGSVTVSGDGSQWNNSGGVFVGGAGQGNVTLQAGATGRSGNGLDIGVGPGVTGAMTLTGVGSTSTPTSWTNAAGTVLVGDLGTGTLTIQNGALLSNVGDLLVGNLGTGTVTIASGGSVSNVNAVLGNQGSGLGQVYVVGTGSSWVSSGVLTIGQSGVGAVRLDSGASIDVQAELVVGSAARSAGTLLINPFTSISVQGATIGNAGGGTVIINGGSFNDASHNGDSFVGVIVGQTGSGTISIYGGGQMSTFGLDIASGSHSTGEVSVDGSNSLLSTGQGHLNIGVEGDGSLTITNGAKVQSGEAIISESGSSIGRVIVDGAEWVAGLQGGGGLVVGGGGAMGSLTVRNGGVIDFGPGTIEIGILGPGTLTLQNNSEVAANDITIGTHGQVIVQQSTSMLTGNVTNHGSLILDPSTLNVLGNFTLAPDGTLVLDVDGTASGLFSVLNISGLGLFDGTIDLDFIDGYAPKMGDSFDFVNILGEADFSTANVKIDGLAPGFVYTDTFSNGSFDLVAQNDGVSTSATPEPSTLWLFASALVVLSVAVWRKNSRVSCIVAVTRPSKVEFFGRSRERFSHMARASRGMTIGSFFSGP
jgi:fibronectin-binding autotransporter adhesin